MLCPFFFSLPGEDKEEIVKVTFKELRQQVALFAAAMRKMGVETGDRVVGQYFWCSSWFRAGRRPGQREWLGRLGQLLSRGTKYTALGLQPHMRGKQ